MIRRGLILLLLVGAWGCASVPKPAADPHAPLKYRFNPQWRDQDFLCVPDGAFWRCKRMYELKDFLWSVRA